jgi:hypothetical protein
MTTTPYQLVKKMVPFMRETSNNLEINPKEHGEEN